MGHKQAANPCFAVHHPSPTPISKPSSHSSHSSTLSTTPSTGWPVNRRNVLLRLRKIRRLALGEILGPFDTVRGITVALDALIEDLEAGRC